MVSVSASLLKRSGSHLLLRFGQSGRRNWESYSSNSTTSPIFLASGISLYRLSSSVLLAALLLSAGSFMLQEYILPSANQKQDDLRRIIKGRNPQTKRPTRKWMMGEQDRIFHYNFFDDELNVFNRISVFDFDPQTFAVTRMVFAEKAWWDRTRSGWVFEGGWAQGSATTGHSRPSF